jgi:hypothetical protein
MFRKDLLLIKNYKLDMSKKITGSIAVFALVLSLIGAQVSALTAGDISMLQAAGIINATQAASLSASLVTSSASTVSSAYTFAKDLTIGSRGADVTALQNFLISNGYTIAAGATGYFGSQSKVALAKFQAANSITPAAGYFGPKTRAVVNSTSSTSASATSTSASATSTSVSTGSSLAISLAATSPIASSLVAGQAAADIAEYTFTNKTSAPAVVTNVTLQRIGVSSDNTLSSVYLYNGVTRLTDSASVSSGKISFNTSAGIFTVPANSSMTISVKADIEAGVSGQLIAVGLTQVLASVPVSVAYPVLGSSMSVFNATDLASATSSLFTNILAANSISAGSLNQSIWKTTLNVSGRALWLKSLALSVIGSVPSDSFQNIGLYVGGTQVATASGIDANGMITFDLTGTPFKIDSSRILDVRADIINGSNRTFNVRLENPSDLQLYDSSYNVGITVGEGTDQSSGIFTISNGSVTVSRDTTLSSGNVVTGSTNVALAAYTFKAYGEDEKISELTINSTQSLDNVSLYANGLQIGSTKTIASSTTVTYTLGSDLIIPAGSTTAIVVKGDVTYNGNNATTSNDVIVITLGGTSGNATGQYSKSTNTYPSNGVVGPSMTVVGAGLNVTPNASITSISSAPSTNAVKIGSFTLAASESEDVKIDSAVVTLNTASGLSATTSFANMYLVYPGSNVTAAQTNTTNNFSSLNLTIPANKSVVVDVYADIQSATGTASTSLSVEGYGVSSNVVISTGAIAGQVLSVGAGNLSTPTLYSTMNPAVVVGSGTATSVSTIAQYKFISNIAASTISKMYFDVYGPITNVSVGSYGSSDITRTNATIGSLAGSSTVAFNTDMSVPNGSAGQTVTVSATYNAIGTNAQASMQAAYIVLRGYEYTSGNTKQTVWLASTTIPSLTSNSMIVVGSKPTVSIIGSSARITGSSILLGQVKVAADNAGDISISKLPVNITMASPIILPAASIYVTDDSTGSTLSISTSTGWTTGDMVITFNNTQNTTITGGNYKIFDIYGSPNASAYTGSGTVSVTTKLGANASFEWQDIIGAATSTATTTLTSSDWPTNASSVVTN